MLIRIGKESRDEKRPEKGICDRAGTYAGNRRPHCLRRETSGEPGGKSDGSEGENHAGTAAAMDGTEQAANPWIDVRDLKEALKETGVELKAPEKIGDFHLSHVQAIQDGGIVQVFYGSLADQTETQALLRKAKSMEDISGDYTVYPEDRRVSDSEGEVRLRGQDGRVYLATWQRGDYAYSLSLAQGMEEAKVMEVIAEIQ